MSWAHQSPSFYQLKFHQVKVNSKYARQEFYWTAWHFDDIFLILKFIPKRWNQSLDGMTDENKFEIIVCNCLGSGFLRLCSCLIVWMIHIKTCLPCHLYLINRLNIKNSRQYPYLVIFNFIDKQNTKIISIK